MYFCPNCNNVFDVTKDPHAEKHQKGGERNKYESIIEKIIKNEDVSESDVIKLNLDILTKEPSFKKLNQKQKELIHNKIQELLPIDKKIIKEKTDTVINHAYFICRNCGFLKPISDETLIFSRVSGDISQSYSPADASTLDSMANSDILPRTRKYVCTNEKCISHTDPSKKEAVFFRMNNSYKPKYICLACKKND